MRNQDFISKPRKNHGVTLKSILIGLVLIPINCYWIIYTEMVWWAQFPTTMSLFFNVHNVYIHGSGGSFAWQPFNRLQGWLTIPQPPDIPAVSFIVVGMVFTFFLMFMRIRFFWWPFHAVGYAVSGADDWCMNWLWVSLVISTIAKYVILKYGGIKTHRQAAPFFFGLVLGEFVIGSLWSIYGLSTGVRTFMFKDW